METTELLKPTVPEVAPLVRAIYARSMVGCCLHIVLDDGNVDDGDVRFCIERAKKKGHADCEELAAKILLMSKTQRKKLHWMRG